MSEKKHVQWILMKNSEGKIPLEIGKCGKRIKLKLILN
jgi:hypothetical protein